MSDTQAVSEDPAVSEDIEAAPETLADPFRHFQEWFAEAERSEPGDANAMTVATATRDGVPSARIVLLKGWDADGFVFYTNKESRKGQELAGNPRAALLFHWKSLNRQVRIDGNVQDATEAEADAYFASRARVSRLGAWASFQSRPLADRELLKRRLAEMEEKYPDETVPRPPYWAGYRVVPKRIEFWQDMPFRLHDRIVYTRHRGAWSIGRLFPELTIPAEQAATAALLQRLAGAAPAETHISAVFLGADTVWKLRKAVRMPFLDFTGLAERRRCALRELELNAPHAPGLYRDAVAVTRAADGSLTLGGDGEPVDWVVRMARVPATDFFDVIAERGGLTPALLDGLGDAVAACHDALPPVARDQELVLRDIVLGNQVSADAAGMDAATVQRWTDAALAKLSTLRSWLRAREAAGYVRRAHGDLHLGNLCLWRGVPAPFDALEFSEDLATADIAYDFSFLLMDLDTRVDRAAANRVLNRYVARTGDYGLFPGLPLFQSVRAMVRAHIAAARGRAAECAKYLEHALSYLSPPPARVVAVGGLMGTGKSTLARALAPGLGPAPGALVLRSDEIRKRIFGASPEAKLPKAAYAPGAGRETSAALVRGIAAASAAGHAVIADATFMDQRLRAEVRRAAGAVPFLGVWLQAPLAELEARVAARHGDASDADVAVLRRAARGDPGAGDWLAVDSTDADAALAMVRAATTITVR